MTTTKSEQEPQFLDIKVTINGKQEVKFVVADPKQEKKVRTWGISCGRRLSGGGWIRPRWLTYKEPVEVGTVIAHILRSIQAKEEHYKGFKYFLLNGHDEKEGA